MILVTGFIRYALGCIGWNVVRLGTGTLLVSDLHGVRYRITVIHED